MRRLSLGALFFAAACSATDSSSSGGDASAAGGTDVSAPGPADTTPGASVDVEAPAGSDALASADDAPAGEDAVAAPPDVVSDPACLGAADGDACDRDADPCTVDVCAGGVCIATNGVENCAAPAALEPCWTFQCTPGVGCEKAVFAKDIACDDANACTTGDRCQTGVKGCLGDGLPVDDGNPCTADTCAGGVISHTPTDGAACAVDGKAGTCAGDACLPGGCAPVDGGWTAWSYTPCSAPCDGGTRVGTRTCTAPTPACGGAACVGEASVEELCNTQACPPVTTLAECPAGLPFGPSPTCLSAPSTTGFEVLAASSMPADSYGVKVVAGPSGSAAALYAQSEWFERRSPSGALLAGPVSLPALNPELAPEALGDAGFPAFYGPALAFDGTAFGVARPATATGGLHVFVVDGDGLLQLGPVTVPGPVGAMNADQGPAIVWTGDAWLVAWSVWDDAFAQHLAVARLDAALAVDTDFGDGGVLLLDDGARHPELAVSDDGQTAAVVTGELGFRLAVFSATTGDLYATTPLGGCPGGAQGTNGDGNDVVWNEALGEFGVLLSTQGVGLCNTTATSANATILRVTPGGEWIGAPLPVLCGFPIGAGFRGGIAAWPDGRYAVAMQRYHEHPYCVDPFPNGTQGVASFDLVSVDATVPAVTAHLLYSGVPTTYSQTDVVWTGAAMVAMTPKGIASATPGWAFVP